MAADIVYLRLHQSQQVGACHLHALVQINRAQHRLEGICQNRRTLTPAGKVLALAQLKIIAQMNLFSIFKERILADKMCAQLRQLTFCQLRKIIIHVRAHNNAEHRITQKLNPLVMLRFRLLFSFMGIRCMGQSHIKQL